MPSFDAAEWRPVRAWLARLCYRVGNWLGSDDGTGRHRIIVGVRPGDTLEVTPYEESLPVAGSPWQHQDAVIAKHRTMGPPFHGPGWRMLAGLPSEINPNDDALEPVHRT